MALLSTNTSLTFVTKLEDLKKFILAIPGSPEDSKNALVSLQGIERTRSFNSGQRASAISRICEVIKKHMAPVLVPGVAFLPPEDACTLLKHTCSLLRETDKADIEKRNLLPLIKGAFFDFSRQAYADTRLAVVPKIAALMKELHPVLLGLSL